MHSALFLSLHPMEAGFMQQCQDTELPVEVPAGELSQLQVQALQPTVSQAEAQELKQVRKLDFHCPYKNITVLKQYHIYINKTGGRTEKAHRRSA